jgi:hypothetical protein
MCARKSAPAPVLSPSVVFSSAAVFCFPAEAGGGGGFLNAQKKNKSGRL